MEIKAVIMAGGEGTRLRPITCTMPKPLVPLLGKPVIDYCIELLKKHDITNISTTLFYLGSMIENHVQNGEKYGVHIAHSTTPTPLGTAGSVKFAVGNADKPVLVISGDTLTDCNLGDAIDMHKKRGAKVTIVLKRVSVPNEYGVALMSHDNRITRFIEKPESSEVFSDLANTGIYIIEPDVINMIPENRSFDFSLDLFPMLLEKNIPIYGYEMQGYWCDIGSIKQYMQAQRDMLDRKLSFETLAQNKGGVLIEDNTHISENAQIKAPCYIASGCEIGENARIEAYSVIGRGAKVFPNSSIKRSVVMENTVIQENTELRGAIICPEAQIGRYTGVFENSVIGQRTILGQSNSVYNSASIWPDKHISDNMSIGENIVWGIGRRIEIMDTGISGYCNTDVSPETAVRIGSSFASTINKFGQLAVSCDGRRVNSMLKRAVTSGVISQGVDVLSLPHMPYYLFSFTVRHLGLAGGVYITTDSTDSHRTGITLCDHTGSAIQASVRRKVDRIFSSGELRPVMHREIGIVEEVTGTVKAYEADILKNINTDVFKDKNMTVLLDVPADVYEIAAPMLMRQGINVVSANTEGGMDMQMKLSSQNADIGCYVPENRYIASPAFMLRNGKTIQGTALIALFAADAIDGGRQSRFTVPVTFPDEYARMLMDKGAQLITAPEQWHSWQRAAHISNTVVPEFFDPIAAIFRICTMFALNTLNEKTDSLPETYKHEFTVPCNDFGKVLRNLNESEQGSDTEPIDGIKIHTDKGWVIVKAADNGIAACRIICGSFKEEYANELSSMYIDKLRSIINKK